MRRQEHKWVLEKALLAIVNIPFNGTLWEVSPRRGDIIGELPLILQERVHPNQQMNRAMGFVPWQGRGAAH